MLLIAFIPALVLSILVLDSVDTYDTEFREAFEGIADDPAQPCLGMAITNGTQLSERSAGRSFVSNIDVASSSREPAGQPQPVL